MTKVAIITGASSGIGAAIARELAKREITVVLAARRADRLDALRQEIEQHGGQALVVATDVRESQAIERLVQTTVETFGRVDVLVNNAGVNSFCTLADASDAEMEQIVAINLLGPARCARAVIPHMQRQGSGVIINIGSVAGEIGTTSLYSATKFGLHGLNDALRRQLRHDNIKVVLVAPGFIHTAMTQGVRVPMPGPNTVARRVASLIEHPRRRAIVPRAYIPLMYLTKLWPAFGDAVIGSRVMQRQYYSRGKEE